MSNLSEILDSMKSQWQDYKNVSLSAYDTESAYQEGIMNTNNQRNIQDYNIYTSNLMTDRKTDLANNSSQFARAISSINKNFARRNVLGSGITRDTTDETTSDYMIGTDALKLRYSRNLQNADLNYLRGQEDYSKDLARFKETGALGRTSLGYKIDQQYKDYSLGAFADISAQTGIQSTPTYAGTGGSSSSSGGNLSKNGTVSASTVAKANANALAKAKAGVSSSSSSKK